MTLTLYNTLGRQKKAFEPIDPKQVRLYVCGPTVYDTVHIGNARSCVAFDVLARVLKHLYPRVIYVRNITDIEDKIMKRAQEIGEEIPVLTKRMTDRFHEDMVAINLLQPDHEPHATDYLPQMIRMIDTLLDKKHAYEAEGHVLFQVSSFSDYGALSGRNREEQIHGARVEVAPFKKDPADFVLWKPSTDTQPGWESPWGRGRPGWHLECSAMTTDLLGDHFDLHCGGIDLVFPHHENEIAQSRCVHRTQSLANYWLHNGYLTVNGGQKMSKSLGNFFTVPDLLQKVPGEAIRYMLISTHYRAPFDFTWDALEKAKQSLDGLYTALRTTSFSEDDPENDHFPNDFGAALEDDLNTPLALSCLHAYAHDLNKTKKNRSALLNAGRFLGLLQQDPEDWFRWQAPKSQDDSGLTDQKIEDLIQDRHTARQNRDFAESDRIRDVLLEHHIALEDSTQKTSWRRV